MKRYTRYLLTAAFPWFALQAQQPSDVQKVATVVRKDPGGYTVKYVGHQAFYVLEGKDWVSLWRDNLHSLKPRDARCAEEMEVRIIAYPAPGKDRFDRGDVAWRTAGGIAFSFTKRECATLQKLTFVSIHPDGQRGPSGQASKGEFGTIDVAFDSAKEEVVAKGHNWRIVASRSDRSEPTQPGWCGELVDVQFWQEPGSIKEISAELRQSTGEQIEKALRSKCGTFHTADVKMSFEGASRPFDTFELYRGIIKPIPNLEGAAFFMTTDQPLGCDRERARERLMQCSSSRSSGTECTGQIQVLPGHSCWGANGWCDPNTGIALDDRETATSYACETDIARLPVLNALYSRGRSRPLSDSVAPSRPIFPVPDRKK